MGSMTTPTRREFPDIDEVLTFLMTCFPGSG
jgi:hypothetical protein